MIGDDLRAKLAAGEAVVAGGLSGTSGDGIDVVLCRPRVAAGAVRAVTSLTFSTEPFPAGVGERVRDVLDGRPTGLRDTALLHRDLGCAFGSAIRRVAERAGLDVDLAGSHGQTVWHHDGEEESGPATLQLGDGDFVAEESGCTVVSDFRQRDIAVGGEGAPLSALADGVLFAAAPRPLAILNLGGMANLTVLPEESSGDVLAFDTGPAGSLLDGLARRLLGSPFDKGGEAARRGQSDGELVRLLLDHPFFGRRPPKSTGRDTFGERWLDGVLAQPAARGALERGGPEAVLASAVAAVAQSVVDALERFAGRAPGVLALAGGGARNRALVGALAERLPLDVRSSAEHGVDPDAREALVFAVLAARCVLGEPSGSARATGARRGRLLGKISPGVSGSGETGLHP